LKVYDSNLEQIAQKSMHDLGIEDAVSVKCVDFGDSSYLLIGKQNEDTLVYSHDFKSVAEFGKTSFRKVGKAKVGGKDYLFVPSIDSVHIMDKEMNLKGILHAVCLPASPFTVDLNGNSYLVGRTNEGQASLFEADLNRCLVKGEVFNFGKEGYSWNTNEDVWKMRSVPTKDGDLLAVEYKGNEGISIYDPKYKNFSRVLAVTGKDMNFI